MWVIFPLSKHDTSMRWKNETTLRTPSMTVARPIPMWVRKQTSAKATYRRPPCGTIVVRISHRKNIHRKKTTLFFTFRKNTQNLKSMSYVYEFFTIVYCDFSISEILWMHFERKGVRLKNHREKFLNITKCHLLIIFHTWKIDQLKIRVTPVYIHTFI